MKNAASFPQLRIIFFLEPLLPPAILPAMTLRQRTVGLDLQGLAVGGALQAVDLLLTVVHFLDPVGPIVLGTALKLDVDNGRHVVVVIVVVVRIGISAAAALEQRIIVGHFFLLQCVGIGLAHAQLVCRVVDDDSGVLFRLLDHIFCRVNLAQLRHGSGIHTTELADNNNNDDNKGRQEESHILHDAAGVYSML